VEGDGNNLKAEANIARLLGAWRRRGRPVFHVRHQSTFPFAIPAGPSGHDFKSEVAPIAGGAVIPKQTNSAFIGADLQERLRQQDDATLVIAGVITNNSVEAMVAMAGNLGFETYLVEDACFTFGRSDFRGHKRSVDAARAMSLANMAGEYCP
jgi:nicotinamidase-related amidase